MDIFSINWKIKADPSCDKCKGSGLVNYMYRPSTCWDSGIEIGPCRKCLAVDFYKWEADNSIERHL